MARAHVTGEDYESARKYIKKARLQLDRATGLSNEDKKVYLDQIRETEALIDH